jgi:hypothetical protein
MAVNIFKKAKAYRTKHPKISFQEAIQKVSGKSPAISGKKKVSGIGKKKVAGVKRVVASRKVSGRSKVISYARAPKAATVGALAKGQGIIKEINKLENQRKKLKTKIEKDYLALIINKEHDKLDALSRQLKRK